MEEEYEFDFDKILKSLETIKVYSQNPIGELAAADDGCGTSYYCHNYHPHHT